MSTPPSSQSEPPTQPIKKPYVITKEMLKSKGPIQRKPDVDRFEESIAPLTLEEIAEVQNKIISSKIGIDAMTTAEKAKYVNEYTKCERIKHDTLASRKVRFLFNSLAEMGNVIYAPEKFVQCVHCDEPLNAFALVTPENKSVIGICQNFIRDQTTTQNAVAHELLHIYDQSRAYADLNNCIHVACMEVRAAALSGECAKQREEERGALRPFLVEPGHFKRCVWRKAMGSVKFQPLCSEPEVCEKAMQLSFERCFADQAPFYSIPE
jgi:inner membrane protease ATP23